MTHFTCSDDFRSYLKKYLEVQDGGDGVKVYAYTGNTQHDFIFPGSGAEFVKCMAKKGIALKCCGPEELATEFHLLIEVSL